MLRRATFQPGIQPEFLPDLKDEAWYERLARFTAL
jgi:hypothetical protein